MASRKMSKAAHDYIIATITTNGSMSTEEVIELVEPHYDFDPAAARKREIRRYVGQLIRKQRATDGTRTMFLEKRRSEIIDIEGCSEVDKVAAVNAQLRTQAIGLLRSCRKAATRVKELQGQVSMFDEAEFVRDLMHPVGEVVHLPQGAQSA